MLVHKKKRVLILRPRNPEHITATIPTARAFQYKGATMVAVPSMVSRSHISCMALFASSVPEAIFTGCGQMSVRWPSMSHRPSVRRYERTVMLRVCEASRSQARGGRGMAMERGRSVGQAALARRSMGR